MKFVLLISGPSCAGKSTVEAALGKRVPGAYTVAYDKLKWQLAGYHRDKDREIIKDLLIGFFEVVCKNGLPIILQSFMRDEAEFMRYKTIADTYGYPMFCVTLTAPEEILIERFRERVARATAAGSKISVTDEGLYRKNLTWKAYVPEGTPMFDSSVQSADEIADEIFKRIQPTQ